MVTVIAAAWFTCATILFGALKTATNKAKKESE